MAKRFGRNQKRKLRELVSRLTAQIEGNYEPATGKHHKLIDLVGHIYAIDITDSKTQREHHRYAEVIVPYAHRFVSLYQEGGWNLQTEHEGVVWTVKEIAMEDEYGLSSGYGDVIGRPYFGSGHHINEGPRMRLKLTALGRRYKRK